MRRRTSLAATLVAACAALGLAKFAEAGTIDAVSAASLKVTGGTTTSTTASLKFTYTKPNGTWRLFYDVTDHTTYSAFTKYSQVSGSSGTMTINVTGLTAGTKYYYWLQGYERFPTADNSKVHSTFTTDGSSAVELRRIPSSLDRYSVDPLGRQIGTRPGFAPVRIDQDGAGIRIDPTDP